LSSTDWNTFNGKASALSGTTNYVAKFTSSSTIGNSLIFDNGSNIGVSTTSLLADALLPIQINAVATTGQAYFASNNAGGYGLLMGYDNANGYARIRNVSNTALTFETNNIERFRISNAGAATFSSTVFATGFFVPQNEGIGFNGQGLFTTAIYSRNSGADLCFNAGNSEKMRITSAGNVGIGTTSPDRRLRIASDGTNWISAVIGGSGGGDVVVIGNLGGAPSIGGHNSALTAWARLSLNPDGGNVLVGTSTDNGERLYVSGAIRATGTITANSDISLKKNLLKIENALEKVEQINGYTYEFKADDSKRHAGVIAQEIQTVLPEIVNKGNNGILGVEYGNISALLIEAIKEQNIKIKNLETLLASK
jgi:hypothetical protein